MTLTPEQQLELGTIATQRMAQVGHLSEDELRHLARHLVMYLTVNPAIDWPVFLTSVVMARRDVAEGVELAWPSSQEPVAP